MPLAFAEVFQPLLQPRRVLSLFKNTPDANRACAVCQKKLIANGVAPAVLQPRPARARFAKRKNTPAHAGFGLFPRQDIHIHDRHAGRLAEQDHPVRFATAPPGRGILILLPRRGCPVPCAGKQNLRFR
jgi:hypothetical protein